MEKKTLINKVSKNNKSNKIKIIELNNASRLIHGRGGPFFEAPNKSGVQVYPNDV